MACSIDLNSLLPGNHTPGGVWDVGVGSPQVLDLCRDCESGDPPDTYQQPAVISLELDGHTWIIPDDLTCGVYKFKYVTDPGGDECNGCADCEVYEIEVLEGPELAAVPDIDICDAEANTKGLNLWGYLDCNQDTVANPAPNYNCPDCDVPGYVTKPTSCIVQAALSGGTWVSPNHTGNSVGDSANCGEQTYSVKLSFSSSYPGLNQDYDPLTGKYRPVNLAPGASVDVCLEITTQRTNMSLPCDSCTQSVCFTITKLESDEAGEYSGTPYQVCN